MKVGGSGLLAGCPSTRTCRTRRECIAHISASTHVVPRSHINTHGTRAGATSAEDSRSNYRKAAPKTPQMDEARLLFSAGEEGDRNARRVAISIAALPFHPRTPHAGGHAPLQVRPKGCARTRRRGRLAAFVPRSLAQAYRVFVFSTVYTPRGE